MILRQPHSPSTHEKADQLLMAAQHKHGVLPDPRLPVGPENGWKTQDTYENWRRATQASGSYVMGCFPGLSEAISLLREGKEVDIDPLVSYLEESPRFYGSGYLADTCIRYVRRAELTAQQRLSLQSAVSKAVYNQDRFKLKDYCRLARAVDSPELRTKLQTRLAGNDPVVRRRAEIVLHSLTEKDAGR